MPPSPSWESPVNGMWAATMAMSCHFGMPTMWSISCTWNWVRPMILQMQSNVAIVSETFLGNKANIQSHYRGHKLSMWLNLIPQLHRHFNINDQSMRHHQFQDDMNNRDLYEGKI